MAAQHAGLSPALLAAAGLALSPLAGMRYRFPTIPPQDLVPGGDWPTPQLADVAPADGPVLVTVEYRALPGRRDELLAALRDARFSRRRTGASSWRVWQDSGEPGRILEQFVVASWQEHQLQRARVTVWDQHRSHSIGALTDPAHPTAVTHWLTPELRRGLELPQKGELGQSAWIRSRITMWE